MAGVINKFANNLINFWQQNPNKNKTTKRVYSDVHIQFV